MERTIPKNEYANHLEGILRNHGIEVKINSKDELIKGMQHYNDLVIKSFYEKEDFDSKEFKNYRKEQRRILTDYIGEGNQVFLSGRNEVLLTKSAKEQGKYQITYFDNKGAISDNIQDNLEDSIQYLMSNGIVPMDKKHVEYLSPAGVAKMTQKNNERILLQSRMKAQQRALER